MTHLIHDLRHAARSLGRTPSFTAAAVITLALGIGANSAIFTLLDAVLLKPLSLPHADDLVTLYENPTGPDAPSGTPDTTGGTGRFLRFSYPRFLRLQSALGDMGSLAAMTRSVPFAVRLDNDAAQTIVRGQLTTSNYFTTLGVAVTRGRSFTDDDLQRGSSQPVAVVSDGFWQRMLGGSDAAIGRPILINRLPVTVIGIAPPGFVGAWSDAESNIWMPLTMQHALNYQANASSYGPVETEQPWFRQNLIAWLNLVGRLDAESRSRAEAALRTTNRAASVDMSLEVPDARARQSITSGVLVVEPFARGFSGLRARFATSLVALAGMVAIVLLVACANIANLLLARSTARSREIGIRLAVGASRSRLIQQGLIESLLLAGIGGATGFLAGQWASRLLASYALGSLNAPLPRVFAPDLRVLAFTATITLATAFLFGLMPSLRATKMDVVERLAGGRAVISGSLMRAMRPLVAAQLALSFVVVFAAALLGRSLINFSHVDPGFSIDRVVAVAFNPRVSGYTLDQLPALRDRLLAATTTVPGVRSAVISTCGLLANCMQSSGFRIGEQGGVQLNENYVGPGYFATVGIPLKSGREFSARDVEKMPLVAVVSESVARRYFGGRNAIGQTIGGEEFTAEVVGIVGDTRPLSLRDAPVPMVYFPIAQWNQPIYTLAARMTGDAQSGALAIQQALKAAEPGLIIDSAGTMNTYLSQGTGRERLVTYLVSALGALALLLACVGLYGVLSYTVAWRTSELGVRMALGARPADLRDLVLRDAFRMIAVGTLAGLGTAFWANRLIQTLLFDVSPFDAATCAIVIVALAGCALLACSLPAMRASHIDPIRALRAD